MSSPSPLVRGGASLEKKGSADARLPRGNRLGKSLLIRAVLFLWAAVVAAMPMPLAAQEFRLGEVRVEESQRLVIRFPSNPNAYYILLRGDAVQAIQQPVAMALGQADSGTLADRITTSSSGFYRVRQVPVNLPLDSDFDGMDDVFELRRAGLLDPLDESDAHEDGDGDGSSNLAEYRRGTDPSDSASAPPTLLTSSPSNGESGVAVTRETILRFDRPLAPGSSLNSNQFYATGAGRRLLSRIELSSDRRTATLFYLENLPASARVRVVFEGDQVKDALGLAVDADGNGIVGGTAQIEFDTLSITPIRGTAVMGRVFASEMMPPPGQIGRAAEVTALGLSRALVPSSTPNFINRPLEGVIITVDGAEETQRAVTDSLGNFTLTNCPAGRFFVHIDGRKAKGSAWPDGAYYPVVGKAWDAVAGRADNRASGTGEIYLPLVPASALQPVSATEDTKVTFPAEVVAANPALAGVEITVPANALLSDNGARGGRVGIAPVPPDRLPGPLPPGLNLPLVFTVQTDGPSNFDRPVPVRFPNLPDPVTGERLRPGQKAALWSFNHDIGEWEIVGDATVASEGTFVESDPGYGISQPGWHGVSAYFRPLVWAYQDVKNFLRNECIRVTGNPLLCDCLLAAGHIGGCIIGSTFTGGILIPPCILLACISLPTCISSLGNATMPTCLDILRSGPRLVLTENETRLRDAVAALQEVRSILLPAILDERVIDAQQVARVEELYEMHSAGLREISDMIQSISRAINAAPVLESASSGPFFFVMGAYGTSQRLTRGRLEGGEKLRFLVSGEMLERGGTILILDVGLKERTMGIAQLDIRINTPTQGSLGFADISEFAEDADGDGLPDVAEYIIGTNRRNGDTDGDGINDAVEVQQNTDPLDGLAVQSGVIAASDTPGTATDISKNNDLIVVADSEAGIALFNAFAGMNPVLVGQVDTPGRASAVACAGNRVVAADGSAGCSILDISDPANARIVRQVSMGELGGGSAQAAAASADRAFVGTADGYLTMLDLTNGLVVQQLKFEGPVHDVAVEGTALYVVAGSRLHVLSFPRGALSSEGSIGISTLQPESIVNRKRIFVGNNIAYISAFPGYETFDVSNPAQPRQLGKVVDNGPNSFKQIVLNGSGLGLASVGVNPREDGTHDVYLFDTQSATNTSKFVTLFETPGLARAVAIHNGLAYVADGSSGVQVINYLPYDNKGIPPAGTLSTSAAEGKGVARGLLVVRAAVQDDVQVRNVEFFLDGERLALDGNFPFETIYRIPAGRIGSKLAFTAIATDTGGNRSAFTTPEVEIIADTIPPVVEIESPTAGVAVRAGDDLRIGLRLEDNVGVAAVDFTLDGRVIQPHRISLEEYLIPGLLEPGERQIVATARDAAGLETVSVPVNFRVRRSAESREISLFNSGPDARRAFSREISIEVTPPSGTAQKPETGAAASSGAGVR